MNVDEGRQEQVSEIRCTLAMVFKSVPSIVAALRTSHAAREQFIVFLSQLTLNASIFTVLFVTSLALHPSEFAKLSLANNSTMQLANILTLGLDYGALKLSIESSNRSFIAINLVLKATLFLFSITALLIWSIVAGLRYELVILSAAAAVAFWSATISVMQFERHFVRLAVLNGILAGGRIGFGLFAATFQLWVLVILAVHVIAQIPIHIYAVAKKTYKLTSAIDWAHLRPLVAVSPLIFASGTFFSALPLITQTLLWVRHNELATSAFGVVLIFTAPLGTLVSTLHIYLLPQALTRNLRDIDVFGLGKGSINLLVWAFAAGFLVLVLPAALVLDWIYGQRMPPVSIFFVVYFGASVLSSAIGLSNIRSQRWMLIRIALVVNLGRAIATGLPILWPELSSLALVVWSAAVLLGGEIVLWAALRRAEQVGSLLTK